MASRRTNLVVAAGGTVALLVSGGFAYAAVPAADGTITGCYTQQPGLLDPKGALRVVDLPSDCRRYETALG